MSKRYINYKNIPEIESIRIKLGYKPNWKIYGCIDECECLQDEGIISTGAFIIACEYQYIDKKTNKTETSRYYIEFENYLTFYTTFYLQLNKQYFHELIVNNVIKLYFDIDIKREEYLNEDKKIIKNLLEKIDEELDICKLEKINKEKDIIILSSHNMEKKSYHIILHNYHGNREDIKTFVERVTLNMKKEYQDFIDKQCYKPNQTFRMLNSSKRDDPNRKMKIEICPISEEDYKYNKNVQELRMFERCLVNHIFEEPKVIIKYAETIYSGSQNKTQSLLKSSTGWYDKIKIPESLSSLRLLEEKEDDYKVILLFKNEGGYECPHCQRIHENENPYMIINKITKKITFHCRRN